MPQRTFIQLGIRRRWVRILAYVAAIAVLVGVLAGAGLAYVRSRDHATVVSVDEARNDFRRDPGGGSDIDRPRPPAGVYVYETSGYEEVDALGGARHDYPPETTITIRHDSCGVERRWEVFAERWDERTSCPTNAGEEQRTFTTRHEFFGQGDTRSFRFSAGSLAVPADSAPGTAWTLEAVADDGSFSGDGTVVSVETLRIDGEDVETIHVRVTTRTVGSARGESVRESWVRATDGLLVREEARTESSTDSPLGTVAYVEVYEILLRSLTPHT